MNVNSCPSSTSTRRTTDDKDKQQLAKMGQGRCDRRRRGKQRKVGGLGREGEDSRGEEHDEMLRIDTLRTITH